MPRGGKPPAPRRVPQWQGEPVPLRFGRGGCKGQNPLPTTPLSKTPPVFHTVWKRLWTFPRLFHSLWKTMLKSTVCIAVCNPRRPRIRALQQKNTPHAVLWICIKTQTDKFPKPTASPHRMSTNAGGQNPRLSHRKQKKSVHNDRFVAVGTPPDTKKSPQNRPRTRISTIRQGKIRIFRTEPRRQKRQKVPSVAGYSGFPQFPAPYCSCFWMEG